MTTFATARRGVLRRRRLLAIAALASVGALWILFKVMPCGPPLCAGGPRRAIEDATCATALGALLGGVLLLPIGVLLPSGVLLRRWIRRRAKQRERRGSGEEAAKTSNGLMGSATADGTTATALRVRVPSRLRRAGAWAAVLAPAVAYWMIHRLSYTSWWISLEGRQLLAGVSLVAAWWLLEETRFRPRTVAIAVPAIVVASWHLIPSLYAITLWRVVGFGG